MKFHLAGEWQDRDTVIEVTNPYSGAVVDTVPVASADDVETALAAAVDGAAAMAAVHAYDRYMMLRKTADLMRERAEDLARTISMEEGKTLREAAGEVERSAQTIDLSSEEAKRLGGEFLPLDGGHVVIATYERIRSRNGERYHADVAKMLPIAYAVVFVLITVGLGAIYLDIVDPVSLSG